MSRLIRESGLRSRLVVAIMIVAVAVLAGSFLALHQATGSDLRGEIESHLRADLQEFEASPAARAADPDELMRLARAFVRGQSYHPDSRIFAISVAGAGIISNQRALVAGDPSASELGDSEFRDSSVGFLDAPAGFATVGSGDDQVRVLTEPIGTGSVALGTFRVGESLEQVDVAQGSLSDTLVVVGALALIVLLGAALSIATLTSRPLRSMATFASSVDTGGLERRLAIDRGPHEVVSLADSFDHMLDRLQRAFEREREFVADASHELRTPVTIAHGELELLRRDLRPEEQERLDVVSRELLRMERLIAEMLTLASAEDKLTALRRDPIAVEDFLADLRRDLPLLGPRDYRVGELGGTLRADSDQLAQVFRNLVANAVVHTAEGGVIEVRSQGAGDRVVFTVSDDGPGVESDELDHLFDRFYRTSEGRSRDQRGTGLGLAIAQAIVESHGGAIRAGNAAAGGLEVIFELPGYRA